MLFARPPTTSSNNGQPAAPSPQRTMAHSSPSRRSHTKDYSKSSPERGFVADFLAEDRNSELSHRDALAAAQLEHERVRLAALRVYEVHQLQEEQKRLEDEKRRIAQLQKEEEERLKAEAAVRAEQERLRELRAKQIPQLPPEPQPEPPKPAAAVPPKKPQEPPQVNGTSATKTESPALGTNKLQQNPLTAAPPPALQAAKAPPAAPSPLVAKEPSAPPAQANGFQTMPAGAAAAPKIAAQPSAPAVAAPPATDRYIEIHQALKKLRQNVEALSKQPGSPLKGKLGDMRRQIRKSIGQLTAGKGANVTPMNTINATLRESLDGRIPSPMVDVRLYVQEDRQPVEGAVHNDAQMPALFLYLLNILSKAIIGQFANEGGANPKSAEPVGIVAAQIFSNKDYHWRGATLIDILIAKFRVACPVLFGSRGSDRTEAGRKAIGWKREDGNWIPEQSHNDRMTGLGAGFASIALRDFSKASKTNPYPPTHYWTALAKIVNSPPQLVSNTQYVVLKSMINGHEARFITFYGNAAIAALRLALVQFPQKAPAGATAAQALQVHADVLRRDVGLDLS